jgi:hypothetical protein
MDAFPAVKFFSSTDQTTDLPTPITCVRVDKHVNGGSWRDWASWYKLLKLIEEIPFV